MNCQRHGYGGLIFFDAVSMPGKAGIYARNTKYLDRCFNPSARQVSSGIGPRKETMNQVVGSAVVVRLCPYHGRSPGFQIFRDRQSSPKHSLACIIGLEMQLLSIVAHYEVSKNMSLASSW